MTLRCEAWVFLLNDSIERIWPWMASNTSGVDFFFYKKDVNRGGYSVRDRRRGWFLKRVAASLFVCFLLTHNRESRIPMMPEMTWFESHPPLPLGHPRNQFLKPLEQDWHIRWTIEPSTNLEDELRASSLLVHMHAHAQTQTANPVLEQSMVARYFGAKVANIQIRLARWSQSIEYEFSVALLLE